MNRKIAYLTFPDLFDRARKNKNISIGLQSIINRLKTKHEIKECDVNSARLYDIILVSLMDIFDIFSFASYVNNHQWKRRHYIVIVGGFGVQNTLMLNDFADYAWFGRCDYEIFDLIEKIPDYTHQSLLDLTNECNVTYNQKHILNKVRLKNGNKFSKQYNECIFGCPNKCYYCHYSFSRKYVNYNNKSLYESIFLGTSSKQLEIKNYNTYTGEGYINTAIDGFSEKLRYFVNKKIDNEDIVRFFEHVENTNIKRNKGVYVKLYNIIGYEIETNDDYIEFVELMKKILTTKRSRIFIEVQNNKLIPSPLTPISYAPIHIGSSDNITGSTIFEINNSKIVNSKYTIGDFRYLCNVLAVRYTNKYYDLFMKIINNEVVNLKQLLLYDINDIIREYSINEKLPTDFVKSYTNQEIIKRLRCKMLDFKEKYA